MESMFQIYSDKKFSTPIDKIIAFDNHSFKQAFDKIQEYKELGKYLLGYVKYEAKNIFLKTEYSSKNPILYFEVFDGWENYEEKTYIPEYITSTPLISKEKYVSDILKIKEYISEGITYEVNYTYPSEVHTGMNSLQLYETLLKNQKTKYNAFIQNEYETLLSFSPELFFRIEGNKIITKPMKGTIHRGKSDEEDKCNINFLYNDEKNRAENVMIVDLLRNDLSRISQAGSVNVEKLFEIETHKTLHQMTSTISGLLRDDVKLYDIFESIFPCGSITGAPKISTMRVIDELEPYERGIYCGAIGYISPEETVFSVPIRILTKEKNSDKYICNTGGAIVWHSDVDDEWEETLTKRKFLEVIPEFHLIETMKVERGEALFFEEHLNRLRKSADELGFVFSSSLFDIKPKQDGIMRISLSKSGEFEVTYRDILPNKSDIVRFSRHRVNSKNTFLYHKTDYRTWYESSFEPIKNGDVFDEIYMNEREEVTEGSRSNVVIEKNGRLFTPPINSGILGGIYRAYMLKNRAEEKLLYAKDLIEADKIYCVNSVRGCVEVKLCL
jgi:para-aminobenzoate synthetase/4-amino-4-deoxychorismate lyase